MSKRASKWSDTARRLAVLPAGAVLAAATLMVLLALSFAAPAQATVVTGNPGGNCVPTPGDYDGNGSSDLSQLCDGAWFFYSPTGTQIKGIWVGFVAGDKPIPADYDGDGDTDLAIYRSGAVYIFDYGTGAVTNSIWLGNPGGNCVPVPADITGDGKAELSILCDGAWFFVDSTSGTLVTSLWVGAVPSQVAVPGDYSGTGRDQAAVYRNGAWETWGYTGSWAYTGGTWTLNGQYPAPIDFDGDGDVDFTVFNNGAWFFFNDAGVYAGSVWTGGVAGDIPVSRRIFHP